MLYANRSQIRRIISRDRLDGYFVEVKKRHGACDLLEAFTFYSWNTILSESFYAPLQALEVALRNTIQVNANLHFNNPYWFEDTAVVRRFEYDAVQKAKQKLQTQKKNIDAGRIIAELHFGFWNGLFYNYYEQKLWRPLGKKFFPKMDPNKYDRKAISKKIKRIRDFRNRIFHFEPIWYFKLKDRHDEILEMLSWIEPAMVELLDPVDHFQECYAQAKVDEIRESLRKVY